MIKHIYYLGDKISDNLFQLKNSDEQVEQIRKLFGDKHFSTYTRVTYSYLDIIKTDKGVFSKKILEKKMNSNSLKIKYSLENREYFPCGKHERAANKLFSIKISDDFYLNINNKNHIYFEWDDHIDSGIVADAISRAHTIYN